MGEKKNSFVREHTKDKPISRRKIFETVLLALFSGLLFGVVAATTFQVTQYGWKLFRQEKESENIKLVTHEEETEEVEEAEPAQETVLPIEAAEFNQEYIELYKVAEELKKSLVVVEAVDLGKDWLAETFEASSIGSGLLIADNNKELLILVDRNIIEDADTIKVTLPDGKRVQAAEKKYDENTNLSIIACELSDIDEDTKNALVMAKFSQSVPKSVLGRIVIAAGSPYGNGKSVAMGRITTAEQTVTLQDDTANILYTDIYGSTEGSGILANAQGEIVGIITMDHADENMQNLICAYAISSVHDTIERLANGQGRVSLGIFGKEVTQEALQQGIPAGIYVTDIVMDSPAMDNGIIVGDVITKIGTNEIETFKDYKAVLDKCQSGQEILITLQRYSRGEYKELIVEAELEVLD